MTIDPATGREMIDFSVLDFDVNVEINAGLGEMPDVEKFNNLVQFQVFCKQIGVTLDPMVLGQIGASLAGYAFDRFNPKPPPGAPPPELNNKLTVTAEFSELPANVQQMLVSKWMTGEVSTDSKIDSRMKEMLHNRNAQPAPDMTRGAAAAAMSEGGQIGGQGGY